MHLLPELYVTPRLADVEKPRFSAVPLVPRLLSHRRVKRSPHDLQFNAAAYSQLVWDNVDQNDQDNHLLIVSPYNENLHLLDLTTLDDPDQILATALTLMRPIRNDYATASYQDSFNWRQIFELMKHLADARDMHWKAHSFYVVTFRSKRSSVPSSANIHELDAQAHREAIASGGLLKYWFGSPDVLGHNLATCETLISDCGICR